MKRLIIFGCGLGGERALQSIRSDETVVAFTDNDAKKHGSLFLNRPVIPPADLLDHEFDGILIASQYFFPILQQLLKLGVPSHKIEKLSQELLEGKRASRFGLFKRMVTCIGLVAGHFAIKIVRLYRVVMRGF